MKKRGIIITFLLLFLFQPVLLLHAGDIDVYDGQNRLYPHFYYHESNLARGKYICGKIDTSLFKPYKWGSLPYRFPDTSRMITLKAIFRLTGIEDSTDLMLVSVPMEYPCNVYLNGHLIGKRGNVNQGYTNRINQSAAFYLPPSLLNFEKDQYNDLVFQLYPKEGETFPFAKVFITNRQDADSYVFWRNFFGNRFIVGMSLSALILFLYTMILYYTRRKNKDLSYLYFSLLSLGFSLSYLNNIISYNFVNALLLEKIVRIGLPLWAFFATGFLLESTNLIKKKNKVLLIIGIIYLIPLFSVLLEPTTTATITTFNHYVIPLVFLNDLFIMLICTTYMIRKPGRKSYLLFGVFFLSIFAAFHDAYFFAVLETKPYVLYLPYIMFGIVIILFFILAWEYTDTYKLALKQSRELKKMHANLETLVFERTMKLNETVEQLNKEIEYRKEAENQLRINTSKLKELNATKDKFFSIIAHDLRNPFNSLLGFSGLLHQHAAEYSEKEIVEFSGIINKSAEKGFQLLQNLLEWSRAQTGTIAYNPEKTPLITVLHDCDSIVEQDALNKEVKISYQIDPKLEVMADQNMLRTIMRNLLTNAVKFSYPGGEVKVKSSLEDGYLLISVQDNGTGISKDDIGKLFRIDEKYTSKGTANEEGSGLGLVLCKEFVEKHGGKIWVESDKGKGSNFTFELPY
ncbi:MAG TPA: HAMP domain-containing sensor histidine kinase [Bacteroidales bacterium]|nr:HAMP domain-containing sensor histidine kinase [Bacteroidales bacterium]